MSNLTNNTFYYSMLKASSPSFAFHAVLDNQNFKVPNVNNQDGTNDPSISTTSTATVRF